MGTHTDAPIHWVTGKDGADIGSIPVQTLVGPACVIEKTAETEAASITEEEAKWLIDRFGPGVLGEPEQRLIQLLKSLSPPSLERLSEVMNRAA